jgi:xanthine dehydrogenase YagR molybdenum-binding subunit
MAATLIGTPVNRVDGRKKVTGAAQYAGEMALGEMTYAVLVGSAVAGGRIRSITVEEAEHAPGVLLVLTHQNVERLGQMPDSLMAGGSTAESRPPLADDRILYAGQYVAMIVAERMEQARSAASLLKVDYEVGPFAVALEDAPETRYEPKESLGEPLSVERGNPAQALNAADVRLGETYSTPTDIPAQWSRMQPSLPGPATR